MLTCHNFIGVARFKVKKIKEVNRCVPINISVCSILTAEKEKPIYGVVSSRTSGMLCIVNWLFLIFSLTLMEDNIGYYSEIF